MRIGFVVNRLRGLRSTYTTTHLAAAVARAGHQALFIETGAFTLDPCDRLLAQGKLLQPGEYDPAAVVAALPRLGRGVVDLQQLDGLVLRNNPVRRTVLDFARALRDRGVPVVNDPDGLAAGAGKLTIHAVPGHLRPRTVVTRDLRVIEAYRRELDVDGVVKPVRGFGGKGVTLVPRGAPMQLPDPLRRVLESPDGYLVFQEYLDGAGGGDKRILLVEGDPVGCYVRMRKEGEFRHNVHVGGRARRASLDEVDREICTALAGHLRREGIFLAGLDVIDRRAVEVNVVAPGGVANIERTSGESLGDRIAAALLDHLRRRGRTKDEEPAPQPGGERHR